MDESFNINVTFPENYKEEFAGKDAVFEVVVKEIRETIPAEINDEMAKNLGVGSIDELRKNIRESQEQELNSFSRMRAKRDLLDILDKEHKFELPEGIYEEQFDGIWAEFERRRKDNPNQIDEDDNGKSDE